MTGQDVAALAVVIAAGWYVARSVARSFRGGGGCSCDTGGGARGTERPGRLRRIPFVPLSSLKPPEPEDNKPRATANESGDASQT